MSDSNENLIQEALKSGSDLASRLPLFGHVAWLYTQSSQHRHFFLQDMESRVLPGIISDQCKLFLNHKGSKLPLTYVSWAYLSEEAEQHFIQTQRIAPHHWKSGDTIWMIDLLSPFGGSLDMLKELNEKIHPDKDVYMLYPDPKGGVGKRTLTEVIAEQQAGKAPKSTTTH